MVKGFYRINLSADHGPEIPIMGRCSAVRDFQNDGLFTAQTALEPVWRRK